MNYDLVLEDLLYKNTPKEYQRSNPNYSVFYKIPITELNNRVSNNFSLPLYEKDLNKSKMPEIIKLHGSINWLYTRQSISDSIYSSMNDEDEYLKSLLFHQS